MNNLIDINQYSTVPYVKQETIKILNKKHKFLPLTANKTNIMSQKKKKEYIMNLLNTI